MALLDGKSLAEQIRLGLTIEIAALRKDGHRAPGLCTILIGEDPASTVYVRNKRKFAVECGIISTHHQLPNDITQQDLLQLIVQLNDDAAIDGILLQLPIPKHIDEKAVLEAIDPSKDVDGFHPINVGLLALGRPRFIPCTPKGCMRLLQSAQTPIVGANVVVIGRSNIVGKPIAQLLLNQNATVTVCHSKTTNITEHTKRADILIVAAGYPHLIGANDVKEGSTIIDVGINRTSEGKLIGDVDTAAVMNKVKAITPVPGGVGPMTIAMLLENTLEAYKWSLS